MGVERNVLGGFQVLVKEGKKHRMFEELQIILYVVGTHREKVNNVT